MQVVITKKIITIGHYILNKAKIYELALDERIDLTLNYFNEIKIYLKEIQSNLYNIKYLQAYKSYKPHTHFLLLRSNL